METTVMLDTEYKYYQDNKKDLVEKYEGKFIVIVGQEVVDFFDSEDEAYLAGVEKYGLGNFLIQLCDNNNPQTQTFHSRVTFA